MAPKNDGYRYLLVVVDVLSRMVYGAPVKSKYAKDVKEGFESIFKQMPLLPQRLFTDQGNEFESKEMKDYFKYDKEIDKQCSKDKSVKAGVAERMIRTIKQRLYRYFSERNTINWIDVITKILEAINRSVCRVTGMRPVDVNESNSNKLWKRLYTTKEWQKRSKYRQGDAVRSALDTPVFRKGYLPTFTDEIFRVDRVVAGSHPPVHYYLKDYKDEPIEGRFYAPELAKTREDKDTTYRIEKVVSEKQDKKSGERMLRVKFIGYPELYWIRESDLT